jgi:methanogenic corrinoid protein MtbC1
MATEVGAFASSLIDTSRRAWANNCTWRMGETRPALAGVPNSSSINNWPGHFDNLLQHLSAALAFDAPELFTSQVAWLRVAFESHGLSLASLAASLECVRDELRENLPAKVAGEVATLIERARAALDRPLENGTGALAGSDATTALAREYLMAALEGRREDAVRMALGALDSGMTIEELSCNVLARVQVELGTMWHRSQMSVVEEHLVSRTTEAVLTRLHARLPTSPSTGMRVLITSVDGDMHDIGLRVVASHFEMAGWSPVYLGASTPPAEVVMAAAEFEVQLLAVGAKLVTQLRSAAELVKMLRSDVRTQATPVIFGGQPFDLAPNLWKSLGADGCASGAAEAVALGARLVLRT